MYIYSDPSHESDGLLPNVEVWNVIASDVLQFEWNAGIGWYYAYGFPGCLWDSEPIGPFDTEDEAIADMRDNAA